MAVQLAAHEERPGDPCRSSPLRSLRSESSRNDKGDADGTDVEPTIKAGAPWISLGQDGTRYFDYHHTPDDTLDKIDPAQLRQNVAAWTAVLAILSGGIEPEPKRRQRR